MLRPIEVYLTIIIVDRTDYIVFYHLRSYDRINAPNSKGILTNVTNLTCFPIGLIEQMERNSGVKFSEAQVALARQWVSGDYITTQKEVILSMPQEETLFPSDKPQATEKVAIPPDDNAAKEMIDRFERGAKGVRDDSNVSDTVAQHMLDDKTSLEDEVWLGSEEEELYAYVAF